MHGIIKGVPMPFPFEHSNACRNSNLTCPLEAGKTYTYTQTMNVLRSYPQLRVYVRWQLWDGSVSRFKFNNGPDVCVVVSAQIQDPDPETAVGNSNFLLLF